MTAAIFPGRNRPVRIGKMLLLCCYCLHLDNQTDVSENGPN
jgi:hypothetical protein